MVNTAFQVFFSSLDLKINSPSWYQTPLLMLTWTNQGSLTADLAYPPG